MEAKLPHHCMSFSLWTTKRSSKQLSLLSSLAMKMGDGPPTANPAIHCKIVGLTQDWRIPTSTLTTMLLASHTIPDYENWFKTCLVPASIFKGRDTVLKVLACRPGCTIAPVPTERRYPYLRLRILQWRFSVKATVQYCWIYLPGGAYRIKYAANYISSEAQSLSHPLTSPTQLLYIYMHTSLSYAIFKKDMNHIVYWLHNWPTHN